MNAIKHGQIALTRHTKGMRHALRDQTIDQEVASQLRMRFGLGHVVIVPKRSLNRTSTSNSQSRAHASLCYNPFTRLNA